MSAFVTGASGFIGSHLVNELKKEHKVVALVRDVVPSRWLDDALSDCILVRGDIRNLSLLKRVMNQYRIQHVYHLSAQAIVSRAVRNPMETFDVNVMGTLNVLEACRQFHMDEVLVMSTDKVYGDQMDATPENKLITTEPYGTSKVCQDHIARCWIDTYGMNIIVPRSCNAYGLDYSNRIIPNTIEACLRQQSPIIYEGEKNSREYIYVADLVEALAMLMETQKSGVFNVTTNELKTQEEVVLEILRHFPHLSPRHVKREPLKEIQSQSMTCSSFGWKPKHSFEEGIKLTIEKFKQYRQD